MQKLAASLTEKLFSQLPRRLQKKFNRPVFFFFPLSSIPLRLRACFYLYKHTMSLTFRDKKLSRCLEPIICNRDKHKSSFKIQIQPKQNWQNNMPKTLTSSSQSTFLNQICLAYKESHSSGSPPLPSFSLVHVSSTFLMSFYYLVKIAST